ncbi:SGNH/GDSL hydrolase family protein [Bosea sp. 124]|uniref:SGNH/GDSL hydrolase family protein n=1 Tax=Bosea sp. 124 TaxID=2135642 RepID=UPI000D38520B|nr:SGNH/GDSL hydrolase family protein [Bosea sp. 124]PTM41182.1 lysophospholipase L1-like esterase [Bosea sp. 124]
MTGRFPAPPLAPPPATAVFAPRLLATIIVILPLALIFGSLAGFAIGRVSAPPSSYRDQRLAQITTDLRRVEGDYLLAAGDSHVARWRARELCGLPLVNAGIHGATTRDTDDILAELALPRPPRAIILTVGTNDANRKRFRDPPEASARFRHTFRSLLKRLSHRTDLVIVTGLPRMDTRQVVDFSAEAIAGIGSAAETSCLSNASCRVAGTFADDDALIDGLHLADYERAYRRIAPTLCAALAGERPASSPPGQNAGADAP